MTVPPLLDGGGIAGTARVGYRIRLWQLGDGRNTLKLADRQPCPRWPCHPMVTRLRQAQKVAAFSCRACRGERCSRRWQRRHRLESWLFPRMLTCWLPARATARSSSGLSDPVRRLARLRNDNLTALSVPFSSRPTGSCCSPPRVTGKSVPGAYAMRLRCRRSADIRTTSGFSQRRQASGCSHPDPVHEIRLWKLPQLMPVRTIEEQLADIRALAFSKDGQRLASGTHRGDLRIWHTHDGTLLSAFNSHLPRPQALAFSGDGKTLASAMNDGTLRLWYLGEGPALRTLQTREDAQSIAFSSDASLLAAQTQESVQLWRLRDGTLVDTLRTGATTIPTLAFSPDGFKLTVGTQGSIALWDLCEHKVVQRFVETNCFESITLAVHGSSHVCAGWRFGQLKVSIAIRMVPCCDSLNIQVRPWDRLHFSGCKLARDRRGRHQRQDLPLDDAGRKTAPKYRGVGAANHFTGVFARFLAFGSRFGRRVDWLWRTSDLTLVHELKSHEGSVTSVVFSPDGRWLASGSDDGTVRLWSVEPAGLRLILRSLAQVDAGMVLTPRGMIDFVGSERERAEAHAICRSGDAPPFRSLPGPLLDPRTTRTKSPLILAIYGQCKISSRFTARNPEVPCRQAISSVIGDGRALGASRVTNVGAACCVSRALLRCCVVPDATTRCPTQPI